MDIKKYHRLLIDADASHAALHQCAERRRELRTQIRATEQRQAELATDQRTLTFGDQRRLEDDQRTLAALDDQHAALQSEYRTKRALADACRRYVEQKGGAARG